MPLLILTILLALLLPAQPRAQTPPAPLTRIAFGSCADEEKPQPIWEAVMAYRPELFLFAGDNVYGDVRDGRNVPEEELIDGLGDAYGQARICRASMCCAQPSRIWRPGTTTTTARMTPARTFSARPRPSALPPVLGRAPGDPGNPRGRL